MKFVPGCNCCGGYVDACCTYSTNPPPTMYLTDSLYTNLELYWTGISNQWVRCVNRNGNAAAYDSGSSCLPPVANLDFPMMYQLTCETVALVKTYRLRLWMRGCAAGGGFLLLGAPESSQTLCSSATNLINGGGQTLDIVLADKAAASVTCSPFNMTGSSLQNGASSTVDWIFGKNGAGAWTYSVTITE